MTDEQRLAAAREEDYAVADIRTAWRAFQDAVAAGRKINIQTTFDVVYNTNEQRNPSSFKIKMNKTY